MMKLQWNVFAKKDTIRTLMDTVCLVRILLGVAIPVIMMLFKKSTLAILVNTPT